MTSFLDETKRLVEQALDLRLPPEDAYPPRIHEALRYSACDGGKRLRGILAIAAAGTTGGGREAAMQLAAALEMIHAYSLIHDDLPCMDDDDYRRGKLSSHRAFGEGIAVLAGDALLTRAFEVLSKLPEGNGVSSEKAIRIIREVAGAIGTEGLIGGQVMDLEMEGKSVDRATLEYIHSRKTGALFKATVRAGALLGDCPPETLEALTEYAENLGMAFQIADDLLDASEADDAGSVSGLASGAASGGASGTARTVVPGTVSGSDARLGKATFPALFGAGASRSMAEECLRRAKSAIERLGEGAAPLVAIADLVAGRMSAA